MTGYISHGLPSDTMSVEILLELPEIWTLLHRAVGSHFAYTEQSTNTGSCVLAIGLVLRGWKYHAHFNELRT